MTDPKDVDVDGVKTRYFDAGAGETILFIYGGNFGTADAGASCHAWDLNFNVLAERLRVVALDKLGQGYTDNPLTEADYTMAAVVRHIAAFIDRLGLPPVHVVGHSRGGYAATRLALEYSQKVKSLTIVSSGTLSPRISTNEVQLAGQPHPPYTRESSRWIYEKYCHVPSAVSEEWLDRSWEVLQQPKIAASVDDMWKKQAAYRYWFPELARHKTETLRWLREGRLQRPTQIIWGLNDLTVDPAGGFDLFEMIAAHQRQVELTMFNHTGHFAYREHPDRFNTLLASFVDQFAAQDGDVAC